MNTDQILEKYGYCHVPAGTVFYRKGDINKNGTHFALHPTWAFGGNWKGREIASWVTTVPLNLLFLISHLSSMGNPQTTLISLYQELVDPDSDLDDLQIKGQVLGALRKLATALERLNLAGWLTTQENRYPLEIFLLPSILKHIRVSNESFGNDETTNALRKIELFETELFIRNSKKAIQPNVGYL